MSSKWCRHWQRRSNNTFQVLWEGIKDQQTLLIGNRIGQATYIENTHPSERRYHEDVVFRHITQKESALIFHLESFTFTRFPYFCALVLNSVCFKVGSECKKYKVFPTVAKQLSRPYNSRTHWLVVICSWVTWRTICMMNKSPAVWWINLARYTDMWLPVVWWGETFFWHKGLWICW
jgi:hypothetical protein